MKKFFKGLKESLKKFFSNLKNSLNKIFAVLKIFFSSLRNWVMTLAFISAIVFISLWNTAYWCKIAGLISLSVALGLLSWFFTIFYLKFVELIEQQKREILENLATQFNKKEYLDLKTPFNEKDDNIIKSKIKSYRNIMIVCWLLFIVSIFFLISMF